MALYSRIIVSTVLMVLCTHCANDSDTSPQAPADGAVVQDPDTDTGSSNNDNGNGINDPKTPPAQAVNGWTIYRDFNDGTVGERAVVTADGFDHTSQAEYSDEQTIYGLSAKTYIKQNSTGFGVFGGYIDFPQSVTQGETLWVELYIYVPSFFEIYTGNDGLKFLRFGGKKQDGSSSGSLDIQFTVDRITFAEFLMIREIQYDTKYFGSDGALTRDAWHRINVEIGVDNITEANGGHAYVTFWLDNTRLTHEDTIQTLIDATDRIEEFLLFTYYNNGSPIDQHVWVDEIHITNERPAWRDDMEN